MMDAKARLAEIVAQGCRDYTTGTNPRRGLAETISDVLLAAGVTVPEPVQAGPESVKAGPVTSLEAACAVGYHPVHTNETDLWRIDAAMPLLARDHGYIKLSEVERRARAWAKANTGWSPVAVGHLVAALTAPAVTSAARTAPEGK